MVKLRYNGKQQRIGRFGVLREHDVVEMTNQEFESVKRSGDWQRQWTYAKKGQQRVEYHVNELPQVDKEVLIEIMQKLEQDGRPIHYRKGMSRHMMVKAIKSVTGATKNPLYTPEDEKQIGVIVMAEKAPGKNIVSHKISDIENKVIEDTDKVFEEA